jgi:hypothetical protein
MNAQRTFLVASLCVGACALALAWRYERSAEESALASASLRRDLAEATLRSIRLNERLAKADKARQRAQASTALPPKGAAGKRGGPSFLDQLANNPDVQNKMLAYQRSGLALKYGALFMKLGLTPEQIAKCEDNLMAREAVDLDLEAALRAQDISPGTPEAAKIRAQLLSSYTAAQTELLGDAGMSQLDTYDSNFYWANRMAGFAGAAAVSGIPLSSDQARQLQAIAVQASHDPAAAAGGEASAAYWARVDNEASAFLTPAQLSLMKSQEFLGPFGTGSRFQAQLNGAITLGDRADAGSGGGPSSTADAHL